MRGRLNRQGAGLESKQRFGDGTLKSDGVTTQQQHNNQHNNTTFGRHHQIQSATRRSENQRVIAARVGNLSSPPMRLSAKPHACPCRVVVVWSRFSAVCCVAPNWCNGADHRCGPLCEPNCFRANRERSAAGWWFGKGNGDVAMYLCI